MTKMTPLTPSPSIVTIIERIPLKPAYWSHEGAFAAGQAYDLAAGDNAHVAEGHIGHAAFFWEHGEAGSWLILLYPWLDRESAARLLDSEKTVLDAWFEKFAAGPRQVSFLDELAVDVGNDA
jgi:hypothetical protein